MHSKANLNKMKRQPTEQKKTFANDATDKGLISNIYNLGEGNGKPTPVFLPGEFYGQRSLVGCCPWGCTESDMTEAT